MPETSVLPVDTARLERYFVELLDKLERIAIVMERFDNVMNPTLGFAEEAFQEELAARSDAGAVRLQPAIQWPVPQAVQQAG